MKWLPQREKCDGQRIKSRGQWLPAPFHPQVMIFSVKTPWFQRERGGLWSKVVSENDVAKRISPFVVTFHALSVRVNGLLTVLKAWRRSSGGAIESGGQPGRWNGSRCDPWRRVQRRNPRHAPHRRSFVPPAGRGRSPRSARTATLGAWTLRARSRSEGRGVPRVFRPIAGGAAASRDSSRSVRCCHPCPFSLRFCARNHPERMLRSPVEKPTTSMT